MHVLQQIRHRLPWRLFGERDRGGHLGCGLGIEREEGLLVEPALGLQLRGDKRGWGAWEVAARYGAVDLNDGPVRGGEHTSLTLGVNWFLNQNVRLTANYIYNDVDHDLYEGQFEITLWDAGPPFNPLDHAPPPAVTDLAEVRIGGLGIDLVRKFTSTVGYARVGAWNRLRFTPIAQ